MLDWVERMDMEASGLMYKQTFVKAPKKEYELPNEEFDEVVVDMDVWQSPNSSLVDAPSFVEDEKDDEESKEEESKKPDYQKTMLV